ncbi:hypothetical protein ACQJBY_064354 [Aegilops geniculata]
MISGNKLQYEKNGSSVHPYATSCVVVHFYLEPTHCKAQERLVLTFFETAARSHICRLYGKTYCLATATDVDRRVWDQPQQQPEAAHSARPCRLPGLRHLTP